MYLTNFTFPGGFFMRVIRWVLKRTDLFDKISPVNSKRARTYVIEIQNKCSKELSGIYKEALSLTKIDIYVHGSWADNTKTAFSDLDDFIVIDDYSLTMKESKELIKTLNTIDMRFCRIDPLQHHGHWIIGKSELVDYNNSFLPLYILKDACVVKGSHTIKANINKQISRDGLLQNIKNTINEIERLYIKLLNDKINVFELKALVGSFLILPAYVFQYKGYEYDKPTAIKNINKIYTKEAVEFIKTASKCRMHWNLVTNSILFKIFSIFVYFFVNPHLWRMFALKFAPKINPKEVFNFNFSKKSLEEFINETLQHAE